MGGILTMKHTVRVLMAALAVIFCLGSGMTAYAYTDESADAAESAVDTPETVAEEDAADTGVEAAESETSENGAVLTPDGTGTVVDTVTEADGKEFYTITTEAGNIFYLIIDREKDTDNVYFLNAVTESDLMALAEQSDGTDGSISAITGTDPVTGTDTAPDVTDSVDETDGTAEVQGEDAEASGSGNNSVFLILFAVLAVGGVGYYFKIYRPKHQDAIPDEEFDEDYEDEGTEEDGSTDLYGDMGYKDAPYPQYDVDETDDGYDDAGDGGPDPEDQE